ncbi:hypothetical protein, partial [Haloferax sp. KTX1]|uniref:hypothetical protein n=1 Tax=Haloferax sp. KTX1 TaxID=2600597 RepID=UPI001C9E617D
RSSLALHRLLTELVFAWEVPAVVFASDMTRSLDVDDDAGCWRLMRLSALFQVFWMVACVRAKAEAVWPTLAHDDIALQLGLDRVFI